MPTGAGASPPPARLRRAAVAVVGTAVLLGGCSSQSSDPTSASTPPPPSPSPTSAASSPVPAVEPAPRAPRPVRGRTGQRAFAEHVIDLWGYALRTNDAEPLTTLSAGKKPCGGCPALTRTLAQRRSEGWTVDLDAVHVRRIKLTERTGVKVARATVDVPESDSYNTDGSYRNANEAHQGATFEVQMRFAGGRYRLVSFTVS
jgi:hypothetical protein